MTQEIQLRNAPPSDLAEPLAYDQPLAPQESIFVKVHRLLRGRYHWCIILCTLGLAVGGYLGFKAAKPIYAATGVIRIKPVVVKDLSGTQDVMAMFDSFVQSQASLLRSQRVIEYAMQSDDWKRIGRPLGDDAISDFLESLVVTAPRGEVITLSFRDADPAATTAAVKAVLDAYRTMYVEAEASAELERQRRLDDRRRDLNTKLSNLRETIRQATGGLGPEGLKSLQDMKMQNLSKLTAALDEVELVIASNNPAATQPSEAAPEPRKPADLTLIEIARRDPILRQMMAEQRALKTELELGLSRLGERHQAVIATKNRYDAKTEAIEEYAREYRESAELNTLPAPTNLAGATREQLEARRAKYIQMRDATQQDITEKGRMLAEVGKQQREEEILLQDLEQTRRRLDQMTFESQSANRIILPPAPERPLLFKDSRKQYAAAGGILGSGLGLAIMLAIGLADRRMRSVDDARSQNAKLALLGILPSLPDDLADPEQAAIAAHCVHQIRTLLQISTSQAESRVLTITSPAAGTGKTSLCLSLGVSFAAAESRTLLIDCDIVGGGLTARVDTIIRRKIGQILRKQGLINQQQLESALKVSRNTDRRLGEVLVDLGYLGESELSQALSIQDQMPVGLLDALTGESLDDCIAETGIQGLSILPLGSALPTDVSRLSPAAFRRLLDKARAQYETILIDTGPVPGSLEASVVSAAADGVVLVVSRGEHRPMAERCIQHLRDIGAVILGMVFNRAEGRDMEMSSTTTRLSSLDRTGRRTSVPRTEVIGVPKPSQDPIALAMAGRDPAHKANEVQR